MIRAVLPRAVAREVENIDKLRGFDESPLIVVAAVVGKYSAAADVSANDMMDALANCCAPNGLIDAMYEHLVRNNTFPFEPPAAPTTEFRAELIAWLASHVTNPGDLKSQVGAKPALARTVLREVANTLLRNEGSAARLATTKTVSQKKTSRRQR